MECSTDSLAVPLSALADWGETDLDLEDAALLRMVRQDTPDDDPPPCLAERTIARCNAGV